MRNELMKKILDETPKEVDDFVRKYVDKILMQKELFDKIKNSLSYDVIKEEKGEDGFCIFPNSDTLVLSETGFGFYAHIKNYVLGRQINKELKKKGFSTRISNSRKRKKDQGYFSFLIFNEEFVQLEKDIKKGIC